MGWDYIKWDGRGWEGTKWNDSKGVTYRLLCNTAQHDIGEGREDFTSCMDMTERKREHDELQRECLEQNKK